MSWHDETPRRARAIGLPAGPPDIVLLGTGWRPRALIRAQLIEDGYEVLATNSWATTRRALRPGSEPHLVIIDLEGLPQPAEVLRELRGLMHPNRVLILSGLGTVARGEIERLGFHVVTRPIAIRDVIAAAAHALEALE